MKKRQTFDEYLKESLKDPVIKKAFDKETQRLERIVAKRKQKGRL